jgi:predicted cupin superfamily sugar epimerase
LPNYPRITFAIFLTLCQLYFSHMNALYFIEKFSLSAHPEGGYYSETYRSSQSIIHPKKHSQRSLCTQIYFLLENQNFSSFHCLSSDETWHFYHGDTITLYIISPEGHLSTIKIGSDIQNNSTFQFTIPAHHWFAAEVEQIGGYGLIGCTVAPGFDFEDFELGKRTRLVELFPQHRVLIEKLTRD